MQEPVEGTKRRQSAAIAILRAPAEIVTASSAAGAFCTVTWPDSSPSPARATLSTTCVHATAALQPVNPGEAATPCPLAAALEAEGVEEGLPCTPQLLSSATCSAPLDQVVSSKSIRRFTSTPEQLTSRWSAGGALGDAGGNTAASRPDLDTLVASQEGCETKAAHDVGSEGDPNNLQPGAGSSNDGSPLCALRSCDLHQTADLCMQAQHLRGECLAARVPVAYYRPLVATAQSSRRQRRRLSLQQMLHHMCIKGSSASSAWQGRRGASSCSAMCRLQCCSALQWVPSCTLCRGTTCMCTQHPCWPRLLQHSQRRRLLETGTCQARPRHWIDTVSLRMRSSGWPAQPVWQPGALTRWQRIRSSACICWRAQAAAAARCDMAGWRHTRNARMQAAREMAASSLAGVRIAAF